MKKLQQILFYCLILFLPTQLGLHFWPSWAFISGLRLDYFSPTIYFTDVLVILIFLLSLRGAGLRRLLRSRWSLAMTGGLLFIFLNIHFSLVPEVSFYKWTKVGEFIFLAYWVSKNISKSLILNTCLLLSFGVLIESFLVFSQFFQHGSVGGFFYFLGERFYTASTPGIAKTVIFGQEFLRPYGTFSHPNVLAGFLVTIFPLILNQTKKYYDKKGFYLPKIIFITSLVLVPITTTMTISRIGIFVMTGIIFIFSFPYLFPKNLKPNPKKIFFAFMVLFLMAIPFRWQLNQLAIEVFLKNSFLGIGLGTFPLTITKGIFFQPAHNIYLLILSETGLIGFSLFLILIIKTLNHSLKIVNCKLKIPIIIILFLGFFDHYFLTLQQTQLLFSIILGLSWSKIK